MTNENSEPTTSVDRVVHTPGPWKVSRAGRSVLAGSVKINQSCGPCASSVSVQNNIDAELRGNARLVSLAPEMLSGIKDMLDAIEYSGTRLVGKEYEAKERLREILVRLGM